MPRPTPGGVPVVITSPGWSSTYWDTSAMMRAIVKIMSLVLESWMRWPLRSSQSRRFCTSPTSSGVTSQGPSGPKVGNILPLVHWPLRSSWNSRSEMSLQTQ